MELFAIRVNCFFSLTIYPKNSIVGVQVGSKHAPGISIGDAQNQFSLKCNISEMSESLFCSSNTKSSKTVIYSHYKVFPFRVREQKSNKMESISVFQTLHSRSCKCQGIQTCVLKTRNCSFL